MSSQNTRDLVVTDDEVAVGVVGVAGEMGHMHGQILTSLGARVVAGADISPRLTARAAALGARPFASVDEMVEAIDAGEVHVDALVNATPNAKHEEGTVPFLERGIPVYLEKPTAHELDSAERIVAAAERGSTHVMLGTHLVDHPLVAAGLRQLKAEIAGRKVTQVAVVTLRADGKPDRPAFTNHELTGGAAVIDLTPHPAAVATEVIGFPSITAMDTMISPAVEAGVPIMEDWAVATGELAGNEHVVDGATLVVATGWVAKEMPEELRNQYLMPWQQENWELRFTFEDGMERTLHFPFNEAGKPAYPIRFARFLARVRGEQAWTPEIDHRLARWTQELVHAVYASARHGERLELNS